MLDFVFHKPNPRKNTTKISNEAYNFHKTLSNYSETPLIELNNLAENLGIENVLVKDESTRLDLKAFKILGAIYAIAKYLANYCNLEKENLDYERILSCLENKKQVTFITATDGNHGKAVARGAKIFKQKAIVYLPEGSAQARVEAIEDEGAIASVLNMNYDQAVKQASLVAKEKGYVLIQDTAFNDYQLVPQQIMHGYQTIVFELKKQLEEKVTHVFLQAGVGSFAASIIEAFMSVFEYVPKFVLIEPKIANCYFKSAEKENNIYPSSIGGKLETIMAGLACGEPNPIAYPLIRDNVSCYVSSSDEVAEVALRTLARPLKDDLPIKSGESGGIGIGVLKTIVDKKEYAFAKEKLNLNDKSIVLVINTEGITDPVNYMKIVSE